MGDPLWGSASLTDSDGGEEPECNSGPTQGPLSFTERGFCVRVSVMREVVCLVCGDPVRHLVWQQLALDECHEVRFTACECTCGYHLIAVVVVDLVEVNRAEA